MPGQLVGAGASLETSPLQSQMLDTYEIEYEASQERLALFTEFSTSANDRSTRLVYFESVPALKYQAYDTPVPFGSYTSVQHTVQNYIYSVGIPWSKWDAEDDQTGGMLSHAEDIGSRAAQKTEELIYQVINAATDGDGLPSLPNAPDGAALISSSARFGHANGNAISNLTPTTVAAAHTDWYDGITRLTAFQDTEGKRLHSAAKIRGAQTLVITNELDRKIWEEAFYQTRFEGATAGAPSNLLSERYKGPDLEPHTLIDDGKAFLVFIESKKKPMLVLDRTPFRTVRADDQNSDAARATGQHSLQGEMRLGVSPNLPYGIVQIVDS